jgi:alkanesulfonate monooxygenase SsuD/methylene tetrahydromethanopterin reductase-like flavin-dependent oxidoreductase (luciferase family)
MTPFAPGSVSLRLYPHLDLAAAQIVEELRVQAALAAAHGFDGVMTSEHHGGFAGYLPNPLQAAGWLLEAMPVGWAAACPLLLTLRPPALVAEEVAWLAARFPGRVGLGVAAGALRDDFDVMGLPAGDLAARYAPALEEVARLLRGADLGLLKGDPALADCAERPVPLVSAASSVTAARRAARLGVGILLDSLSTAGRARELIDSYRGAGGEGRCILIRRAWIGALPRDRVERQLDVYRGYSPPAAQAHWQGDQQAAADDPIAVADALVTVLEEAGADCLNLRVHVPGVSPHEAREQIRRLGDEVLPRLRAAIGASTT